RPLVSSPPRAYPETILQAHEHPAEAAMLSMSMGPRRKPSGPGCRLQTGGWKRRWVGVPHCFMAWNGPGQTGIDEHGK
ncbi:MAG: hypothetical protein Q9177_001913, partial [Variospora cf. flavescens]